MLEQSLTLTAVYVAVASIVHYGFVGLAGALTEFLYQPARERSARRLLSALLALMALWFGWSTTR